jgi:hypothetical protein
MARVTSPQAWKNARPLRDQRSIKRLTRSRGKKKDYFFMLTSHVAQIGACTLSKIAKIGLYRNACLDKQERGE